MCNLYETLTGLCAEKGVSGGKMCSDLGISRGMMTDLKMGRKKTLSAQTLAKIAEYFGVSVEYLLGKEQKEKPAKKADITDEDLKFALFHGTEGITDEMFDEVKRFAQFVRERENGKK